MHRLIVTSETYRQSGVPSDSALEKDPANQLFTRYPRRQLSGEAIRDAMLAVSGNLNEKMSGPGIHLPLPPEVQVTLLKKHQHSPSDADEQRRRSIYVFSRRNLGHPMFDVYGRPDRQMSCGKRSASTTPTQALTQLNSEFAWNCAQDISKSIAVSDRAAQINEAFLRILARKPTEREIAASESFFTMRKYQNQHTETALQDFCLALLNSNAFLYVE